MSQPESEQRRFFAVLAYVLPLVGGLIGLAADGGNPLTRVHAQQSVSAVLALALGFLVWALGGFLISIIPAIGPVSAVALFALVIALALFLVINWIIGLVVALRGQERVIPLSNRIALRLFPNGGATQPEA